MAGFNVSPVVSGLGQISATLREIRAEADSTSARLGTLRQDADAAREAVGAASRDAEADTARVRQALDDTVQQVEDLGHRAKPTIEEILAGVTGLGKATSDLLARYDAMQEQVPPQLRAYIDLSAGMKEIVVQVRGELNSLRDQVQDDALSVEDIIDRLGELQTIYAQRILAALARLKTGGEDAMRELEQLLSEARRIPDSATGVLAAGLADALDNARRNGQL